MIRIDDTLLEEIGLISLPKADRDQMLRQIYETLEMRVGMRLAERMSDQQLDEFERFIDTNDEAGALKWLESNFPDYKQVVADELEKLKAEIKKDSTQILQAMQAQAASGQPAPGVASGQQQPAPQQFGQPPQPQPAQFNPPAPQAAPQPQFAPSQPPAPQAPPTPPTQPQPFQPIPTPQPAPQNDFAPSQPPAQNDDHSAPGQSGSIPPPPQQQ